MPIIAKMHTLAGKTLLVLCDNDLLGKKFEEGKLQLNMASSFYQGEQKSEGEIEKRLPDIDMFHFVGEESVAFGVKQGLIEKEKIIFIKKVPHAQIVYA